MVLNYLHVSHNSKSGLSFYRSHHKHEVSPGEDPAPLTCSFLGVLYHLGGTLWSAEMTCLGMLLDFKFWIVLFHILFMFTGLLYFPKD